MDDPLEAIKATAEIAKAVAPILENFAKLTGPLCEETGLYFGDRVRAYRQRNLDTVIDGSVKKLEEAGRQVNAVPPRLLLPMFEASSLEDSPTLQDMWSGLLASASDQANNMSPSFIDTLKAMTPVEAKALKVLYGNGLTIVHGYEHQLANAIAFGLDLAVGDTIAPRLIIETMERLGLLRREYELYDDRRHSDLVPRPSPALSFPKHRHKQHGSHMVCQ